MVHNTKVSNILKIARKWLSMVDIILYRNHSFGIQRRNCRQQTSTLFQIQISPTAIIFSFILRSLFGCTFQSNELMKITCFFKFTHLKRRRKYCFNLGGIISSVHLITCKYISPAVRAEADMGGTVTNPPTSPSCVPQSQLLPSHQ